jgi:tetratricopeptide (TPR) repeat protein
VHRTKSILKGCEIPVVAILAIIIGGITLLSPLGVGQAGKYGYAPGKIPEGVKAALKRLEQNPNDSSAELNAAQTMLSQGRRDGNAQSVAAADAMFAQMNGTINTAQILRSRAIAQQYLHNFDAALDLLDKVLKIDNGDASALLTRSNILLVQGKINQAKDACRSLARAMRYDLFVLCDASTNAVGEQASASAERLQSFIASGRMDQALTGYAYSIIGEIAMFENDNSKAQRMFAMAQELDPENLRIRMLHADSLLKLSKFEQALEILDVVADTDALLVRRAIALKRSGETKALNSVIKTMKGRIKANFWAGHSGHAREESLYYLEVENDALQALARANVNWQYQREFEDAKLLLDAAIKANSKDDAIKVSTWMKEENVTAPGLVSRLIKLDFSTERVIN